MPFKDLRNQRQQIRTHHLGAGGPCIDMAVGTTLVAAVAEVDLQRCELSALQGRENGLNNSHRLHADEADSSRQNMSWREKRMPAAAQLINPPGDAQKADGTRRCTAPGHRA